jgi:hypothetical protein
MPTDRSAFGSSWPGTQDAFAHSNMLAITTMSLRLWPALAALRCGAVARHLASGIVELISVSVGLRAESGYDKLMRQ